MHSLANSEDPDDDAAFHLGLNCLLCQKQPSAKEIHFYVKIKTCHPSIYIMDHHKFITSNQKEESIRA